MLTRALCFRRRFLSSLPLNNVRFTVSVTPQSKAGGTLPYSTIRKWKYIPIGFCLGLSAISIAWYPVKPRPADWELAGYRLLPLKHFSRFWGWLHNLELPTFLRSPLLGLYVRAFDCNMEEAEVEDLSTYSNLQQFFRRSLKPGSRPICPVSEVVSPCDGKVLSVGEVKDGRVPQVKGVAYSLKEFLGPDLYQQISEERRLYQITIYLAPGDYHRFHSPAMWSITNRLHVPGHLFSVSPGIASRFEGLFNLNERVAYVGRWSYGFFSMVPVGATNVGSIRVYFDENLATNLRKKALKDVQKSVLFQEAVRLEKGSPVGEFNMGSTIVLLFELPSSFEFTVTTGDRVKMGQSILK